MGDSQADISAFFGSYTEAFKARDLNSLAEHFSFPCHTSGDSGEIALTLITSAADYIRLIEPLFRHYRRLGVARGTILATRVTQLSERLVQCFVDWDVKNGDGRTIYTHTASYTLVVRDGH
jgi:hypothetical protein